jgi:hypothetical protein
MYVQINQLPTVIVQALKSVEINKNDIKLQVSETVKIMQAGGAGRRGFATIINLQTGEFKTTLGSWGGANMFNPGNLVDLDDSSHSLEMNVCALTGYVGESATLHVFPNNLQAFISTNNVELTPAQEYVLAVYSGFTSAYRKELISRKKLNFLQVAKELEEKKLLKVNKAGAASITTEGKNVVESMKLVRKHNIF